MHEILKAKTFLKSLNGKINQEQEKQYFTNREVVFDCIVSALENFLANKDEFEQFLILGQDDIYKLVEELKDKKYDIRLRKYLNKRFEELENTLFDKIDKLETEEEKEESLSCLQKAMNIVAKTKILIQAILIFKKNVYDIQSGFHCPTHEKMYQKYKGAIDYFFADEYMLAQLIIEANSKYNNLIGMIEVTRDKDTSDPVYDEAQEYYRSKFPEGDNYYDIENDKDYCEEEEAMTLDSLVLFINRRKKRHHKPSSRRCNPQIRSNTKNVRNFRKKFGYDWKRRPEYTFKRDSVSRRKHRQHPAADQKKDTSQRRERHPSSMDIYSAEIQSYDDAKARYWEIQKDLIRIIKSIFPDLSMLKNGKFTLLRRKRIQSKYFDDACTHPIPPSILYKPTKTLVMAPETEYFLHINLHVSTRLDPKLYGRYKDKIVQLCSEKFGCFEYQCDVTFEKVWETYRPKVYEEETDDYEDDVEEYETDDHENNVEEYETDDHEDNSNDNPPTSYPEKKKDLSEIIWFLNRKLSYLILEFIQESFCIHSHCFHVSKIFVDPSSNPHCIQIRMPIHVSSYIYKQLQETSTIDDNGATIQNEIFHNELMRKLKSKLQLPPSIHLVFDFHVKKR